MERYNRTGDKEYLDKAIHNWREAVRLKPGSPEELCRLGDALVLKNELDEALALFRSVLQARPDDVDALNSLGMVEHEKKNYSDALRALQHAVELAPQAANTRAILGHVLWQLRRYDEARAQFETALAIESGNADALEGMGLVYLRQGNNAEAFKSFQSAVRLKSGRTQSWSELGIAAGRLEGWDVAIEAHERAVKTAAKLKKPAPEMCEYILRLACALHFAERIEEAKVHYNECARLDPNWPAANLDMAWRLATAAELTPGDAATAYELACQVRQSTSMPSVRSLDVLAIALAAVGRFEEAVVICRKALNQATPDQKRPIAGRLALYEKRQRYIEK
jgi:tetratricopeptide (TPR) repeat protein